MSKTFGPASAIKDPEKHDYTKQQDELVLAAPAHEPQLSPPDTEAKPKLPLPSLLLAKKMNNLNARIDVIESNLDMVNAKLDTLIQYFEG